VTDHWINEDFNFYDAALSAKYFPGSHTRKTISDIIKDVRNEWTFKRIHLV